MIFRNSVPLFAVIILICVLFSVVAFTLENSKGILSPPVRENVTRSTTPLPKHLPTRSAHLPLPRVPRPGDEEDNITWRRVGILTKRKIIKDFRHRDDQAARLATLQNDLICILDSAGVFNLDDPDVPPPVMKRIKEKIYAFIINSDIPEYEKQLALNKLQAL